MREFNGSVRYQIQQYFSTSRLVMPLAVLLVLLYSIYSSKPVGMIDSLTVSSVFIFLVMVWIGATACDMELSLIHIYIVDSAGQKGTGRWTSLESLKQGVNVSMITAACNARIMSNRLEQRAEAKKVIPGPKIPEGEQKTGVQKGEFAKLVREGLYAAKIAAYAQGFDLLSHASVEYGWNLDFGRIAAIFRAGCIIQMCIRDRK